MTCVRIVVTRVSGWVAHSLKSPESAGQPDYIKWRTVSSSWFKFSGSIGILKLIPCIDRAMRKQVELHLVQVDVLWDQEIHLKTDRSARLKHV